MDHGRETLLLRFMERVVSDDSVGMPEICVYSVLFQMWLSSDCNNPVRMSRSQVMRLSKVRSKTTYHKCIKVLCALKVIEYYPSYHPDGSLVFMSEIK